MYTFGLNRPLYSFGLSYPGYFFVVIPEEGAYTIYRVHEANRFRAAEIANQFLAQHATVYIAHPMPGEQVTDYYSVIESVRTYIANDNFYFDAEEKPTTWGAIEASRVYTAKEISTFTAAEDLNIFSAIENPEYAEVYRS